MYKIKGTFKLLSAAVIALGVALAGPSANAGAITGSEDLATLVVTGVPDLSTPSLSAGLLLNFTGSGLQDYAAVPAGLLLNNTSITLTGGPGANSFAISGTDWGTFAASLVASDTIVTGPSGTARVVDLMGTFTPDPGSPYIGSFDPNSALMVLSFTQSGGAGNSVSLSYTLTTPIPTTIPEPSSLAIMGSLAVIGLVALRRKSRVGK